MTYAADGVRRSIAGGPPANHLLIDAGILIIVTVAAWAHGGDRPTSAWRRPGRPQSGASAGSVVTRHRRKFDLSPVATRCKDALNYTHVTLRPLMSVTRERNHAVPVELHHQEHRRRSGSRTPSAVD